MRAASDRPNPAGASGWGRYGHSAGIRFDCFEILHAGRVIGCALPAKFAIKVICYGYGCSGTRQREVFMGLALRSVIGSPGDHHVMHGEWQVGQIEKRPPLIGTEPRWIWSLNLGGRRRRSISQALPDRSMRPPPK
jgi:hypothetical protein